MYGGIDNEPNNAAAKSSQQMLENTSVTERSARKKAGNPFLRCPSVTPHLSSTSAHHVLVRRVREFVAETDVSRENQTRKIDRTAKELAAFLSLHLPPTSPLPFQILRIADLLIDASRSTNLS